MKMKKELIASCGMNCGVCVAYLREENKCPGCYTGRKVGGRPIKCSRRLCEKRTGDFCYSCDEFPCQSIKMLDKRYREKHGMSEIENLEMIRDKGMDYFLKNEEKRWVNSDGVFCVHDGKRYKRE